MTSLAVNCVFTKDSDEYKFSRSDKTGVPNKRNTILAFFCSIYLFFVLKENVRIKIKIYKQNYYPLFEDA